MYTVHCGPKVMGENLQVTVSDSGFHESFRKFSRLYDSVTLGRICYDSNPFDKPQKTNQHSDNLQSNTDHSIPSVTHTDQREVNFWIALNNNK